MGRMDRFSSDPSENRPLIHGCAFVFGQEEFQLALFRNSEKANLFADRVSDLSLSLSLSSVSIGSKSSKQAIVHH